MHGRPRPTQEGQTGAGHSDNESDDSDSDSEAHSPVDLAERIADHQRLNVRHDAVDPPLHRCPFQDGAQENQFRQILAEVIDRDIIPTGYGLLQTEWEDDEYPLFEVIKIGRRSKKGIQVDLSDAAWWQRAKLWVQALDILLHFENS